MRKRYLPFILLFILTLLGSFAQGQGIQSPDAFLGYPLGSRFTYHHRMIAYMDHVASASAKVNLVGYGETNEKRPLITLFISSEENIKNIEQLRQNNLVATGLAQGEIKGKHIPFVWLSYNVHGDESVSMEAAMSVAYTLATGNKEGVDTWLNDVVVVIDPCENPDGRDRYANWYNQKVNVQLNAEPDSWEHNQPWPGGRYNHYLFDLNRDWAWQTQVESQQRVKLYQQWMPHVHVDLHEMGVESPYFIGTAAKPLHGQMTAWQREFHNLAGENHASHFDKNGWLYYSKEVFDLFYPSYGDTWPLFNGAIGFTYEQGGGGRGGLGIVTQTGDTLTLNDRIAHHYTSSLSTIEVSYKNKEKLIAEFKKFFKGEGNDSPYKSFVVKGSNKPERIKALLALMDKQQIRYGYAQAGKAKPTGFDYMKNLDNQAFSLDEKDIVFNTDQPLGKMVAILMEPKSNYEDSMTYDLTAWSLPYAYQLEAYASKTKLDISNKKIEWNSQQVSSASAPYAYLVEWNSAKHVAFLAELLKMKFVVRFAHVPFQQGGKDYDRGTLIVMRGENEAMGSKFDVSMQQLSNKLGVSVVPTTSGMVQKGKDFGSDYVSYIKPPKIGLVGGPGASPTSFGEAWHYFEQQIGYPVNVLETNDLLDINLSEYDVLVMVSGYYSRFNLNEKLLGYVSQGGKLIVMDQALSLFAGDGKTQLAKLPEPPKDEKKDQAVENVKLLRPFADLDRDWLKGSVEGSIFKVTLDATHPLAYGEDAVYHVIKRNSNAYPYLKNGAYNVGTFREDAHVSGFAGSQVKLDMKNTMAIGMEQYGSGQIIYFADSPIFRGFWNSGQLLFGNALFLAGQR